MILNGEGIEIINYQCINSHLHTLGSHCFIADLRHKRHNHHSLEEPGRHAPACFLPFSNISHTNSSSLTRGIPFPSALLLAYTHLVFRVEALAQQDVHINKRWVSVLRDLPCLPLSCSDQQGVGPISLTPESTRMGYESHKTHS